MAVLWESWATSDGMRTARLSFRPDGTGRLFIQAPRFHFRARSPSEAAAHSHVLLLEAFPRGRRRFHSSLAIAIACSALTHRP